MIKAKVIAPDGGWGWMVVLGSWIIDLLVFGFFRGGGIVFIECVRYYGITRAEAAWIPVLTVSVSFLMAPIAGMLVYYYPYRQIVFLGGMTATSGLVICHYAPTITFIYVGYGIILGAGFGLVLSPHLAIVGIYFNRHRALAMGITISGGAVGTFAVGPVMQYLIDEYEMRGAFLILSAILLHVCVAGTLYRPLDYVVTVPPSIQVSDDGELQQNGDLKLQVYSNYARHSATQETALLESSHDEAVEGEDDLPALINGAAIMPKEAESANEEINQNEYDFKMKQTINQNDLNDLDAKAAKLDQSHERSMAPLADIDETKITESDALSEDLLDRALHFASQRTSRVSLGSVLTLPKIVITSADGLAWTPTSQSAEVLNVAISPLVATEYVPPIVGIPAPPVRILLFDELLLLVSISYGITVASYVGIVVILPDYINLEIDGLTAADGVVCISVASAGDLLARTGVGWWIDKLGVKKRFLYQGSLWAFGVIFLLFPLASSYTALLILSVLLGTLYGVCLVHSPCFLADYFSPSNLPFTMGYMMAVAGIPTVFLGLVIGAMRDLTGSYSASCWILGSVLVACSTMWFMQPILLRRHKHRQAKYEAKHAPSFL